MDKKNFTRSQIQPVVIAVTIFLFLIVATVLFTNYKQGLWEKDIRTSMLRFLMGKKSNLEKALYSRIFYTRGVAAYVSLNPEITDEEYREVAEEYIRNDSVISTMALSKNAVINAIYPLEGHEEALGLDLLSHPERKTIVEKTIETKQTFVAGPVELVEGGIAFISYTPIFDRTTQGEDKFWGVTDIVIKQDELLNEAGLHFFESDYTFALRGYNGEGENGKIFWGTPEVFELNPVTINVELPTGYWVLAAIPSGGWVKYKDQDKTLVLTLFISAFIISILIWLFARAQLRIIQNEKELKAVFASLDSLIIEFNRKGEYLKISSINSELLYLPKGQMEGKNLHQIFDKPKADYFLKAIHECLDKKKLVVIEYPLEIGGKEMWFSARISYKSEDSIIFNAYDITEKKNREKLLQQSEQKLKELNETKDKFFSIIAHDLRNPLGSQKAVIDLILEEYENLDEPTRRDLLNNLQESSSHLYKLLENLLEWSLSQSGRIEVNNVDVKVYEKYSNILEQFRKKAHLKNIELINSLDENALVRADLNITETILRNLISNAIKFTNKGGTVVLGSKRIEKDNKAYQKIYVSDNGIGMNSDTIKNLFRIEKAKSTRGTANEKGNGLGLLLCKEFAEKQGTQLEVTSKPGEGTEFFFLLPEAE